MSTKSTAPESADQAVADAEPKPSGLWPKVLLAQHEAGPIAKGGRNEKHGYSYAKAEDAIRLAGNAIEKAELVSFVDPETLEVAQEEGRTSNGNRSISATARGELVLLDPESGERATFPFYGTGVDTPGDKAVYKAFTGGLKYAYAMALRMPFGDDPEDDTTPGAQASYAPRQAPNNAPPFGPPSGADALAKAREAIVYLSGLAGAERVDGLAEEVLEKITGDAGGYPPRVSIRAILHAAAAIKAELEKADQDEAAEAPDPEPAPEADVDEPAEEKPAEPADPEALAKAPAPVREAIEKREAEAAGEDAGAQAELPADTSGLEESSPSSSGGSGDPDEEIPF